MERVTRQTMFCCNPLHRKDHPPFFRDYYLDGPDKWRAKHLPKRDRQQNELSGNHTWELDGSKANVLGRHGTRVVRFTYVLCVCPATRMVLGIAVGLTESTELIRRACWRAYTTYGAPKLIRADMGKAFAGEGVGDRRKRKRGSDAEVVGLVKMMGAGFHECTGRSGWEKGTVEACMRTVDEKCDRLFGDPYVGNNTKNRKQEADRYARYHFDKLPTIEDYERALIACWEAENRRPRKDFDGLSPLQRFKQTSIPERRLPEYAEEFLRRRPQRVKVSHRGVAIRIAGKAHYFGHRDQRVWELQGRQVIAYVDDDDLANVLVCEPDGRPLFYAANDGLVGMDAATLREAGKAKKRAAKLRREHFENADLSIAPTVDVALGLKRKAAEAESAKVASKLAEPERGKVIIATEFGDELKAVQGHRVMRRAVGAEDMATEADELMDIMSVPMTHEAEASGPDITDLVFDGNGQEDHDDDAFAQLL